MNTSTHKLAAATMRRFVPFAALAGIALATTAPAHAAGNIVWRGTVDDVTRIVIRGENVRTATVSGRSATNVNVRNVGAARPGDDVRLMVERGRGDVRIIQRPDRRNDFTTIVEIRDKDRGSAPYEFRLNFDGGVDNRPGNDRGNDRWDNRRGNDRSDDRRSNDRWDNDRDRDAFKLGYEVGRRDAVSRVSRDWNRHRARYDRGTADAFRAGYEEGFDHAR